METALSFAVNTNSNDISAGEDIGHGGANAAATGSDYNIHGDGSVREDGDGRGHGIMEVVDDDGGRRGSVGSWCTGGGGNIGRVMVVGLMVVWGRGGSIDSRSTIMMVFAAMALDVTTIALTIIIIITSCTVLQFSKHFCMVSRGTKERK